MPSSNQPGRHFARVGRSTGVLTVGDEDDRAAAVRKVGGRLLQRQPDRRVPRRSEAADCVDHLASLERTDRHDELGVQAAVGLVALGYPVAVDPQADGGSLGNLLDEAEPALAGPRRSAGRPRRRWRSSIPTRRGSAAPPVVALPRSRRGPAVAVTTPSTIAKNQALEPMTHCSRTAASPARGKGHVPEFVCRASSTRRDPRRSRGSLRGVGRRVGVGREFSRSERLWPRPFRTA